MLGLSVNRNALKLVRDLCDKPSGYKVLTKENMLKGLSVPIHKGALRYY